jgi:hypothetical protein
VRNEKRAAGTEVRTNAWVAFDVVHAEGKPSARTMTSLAVADADDRVAAASLAVIGALLVHAAEEGQILGHAEALRSIR